jgi:hypothetical protein
MRTGAMFARILRADGVGVGMVNVSFFYVRLRVYARAL